MRIPLTRRTLLTVIGGAWLLAMVGLFAPRAMPREPVVVTHWAVTELMDPDLLPRFAEQFNRSGQRTASGRPIVVKPVNVGSAQQVAVLKARVGRGAPAESSLPNPVIVTPKIDHWLSQLNAEVGYTVADPATAQPLAISWMGIATYREMAECLGWPNKEIGLADVIALRQDPRGWASCPTAKAEWGVQPLLSFTDPSSSSTARSALFSLFATAAGKSTDQLTAADASDPAVLEKVRAFQRIVDHYVPDTLVLQSKMYQGPRYGHFYVVEENTLVELYQGKLPVAIGSETKPQPLSRDMVFIYPKEGSLAHNHPAAIVDAPWVGAEEREAAAAWVAYLRQDAQQQAIMAAGFRPATSLPLGDPISQRFGLSPAGPRTVLPPVNPSAVEAMLGQWDEVKKPGIVTFVVDVSGSMSGTKIEQSRKGMIQALDGLSTRNQVGFLSFSDQFQDRVAVGPVANTRFAIADAVNRMKAGGETALYDAVAEGLRMTDDAPGDPDTIRGVVVLTDGQATAGRNLDAVAKMLSRAERPIVSFRARAGDLAVDSAGEQINRRDVVGDGLAVPVRHPIHVFFVGIGADADLEVGRILAEATGAAYQGATDKDLAAVIEKFGKYF